MGIVRETQINDITSTELADLFCSMDGEQQAAFFSQVGLIAEGWPGAGWCQQSYSIAAEVDPRARQTIIKLAEHVLDCDNLEYVVGEAKAASQATAPGYVA